MVKDKKNGSKGKKAVRQPVPIACPEIDAASLEGLIDLLVIKGVINDEELKAAAELYGSYVNGLLDLLNLKGIVEDWELDIARAEFHRFVQALGGNNFIPPAVLFERRRNAVSDRLKLERQLKAGEEALPAT